jgi:DNA-binding transcriptional regulator/RsmH inhibitor MraZ
VGNTIWKIGSAASSTLDRESIRALSVTCSELFARPLIATASPDWKAVSIYSDRWWDAIIEKIWRLPKDNWQARQFMNRVVGHAQRIGVDEAISISPRLVSYAGLKERNLIVAFSEDYAEVWNKHYLENICRFSQPLF